MGKKYGCNPEFKITNKVMNLLTEITEIVGEITILEKTNPDFVIKYKNRIETICLMFKNEIKDLTLEEVSNIVKGNSSELSFENIEKIKKVNDIYEKIEFLNPFSVKDFLDIYRILVNSDNKNLVQNFSKYLKELFSWLKKSKLNILIKSCILHYEIAKMSNFEDGRMGRLWQILILSKWKSFFAWIPLEILIQENIEKYYEIINKSKKSESLNLFVVFILQIIKDNLKKLKKRTSKLYEEENIYNFLKGAYIGLFKDVEVEDVTVNFAFDVFYVGENNEIDFSTAIKNKFSALIPEETRKRKLIYNNSIKEIQNMEISFKKCNYYSESVDFIIENRNNREYKYYKDFFETIETKYYINGLGKPLNFYLEEGKCKNCTYLYEYYTYVTFSIKIIEYKSYIAIFIFGSNY
jgi:fic family protein